MQGIAEQRCNSTAQFCIRPDHSPPGSTMEHTAYATQAAEEGDSQYLFSVVNCSWQELFIRPERDDVKANETNSQVGSFH